MALMLSSQSYLTQNYIRLEFDPFKAGLLDYLGKKLRPFTTPCGRPLRATSSLLLSFVGYLAMMVFCGSSKICAHKILN